MRRAKHEESKVKRNNAKKIKRNEATRDEHSRIKIEQRTIYV